MIPISDEQMQYGLPPVFDGNSRILILGSFPSVKSREATFYYGHPRNRFWRVLGDLLGERAPETPEEKRVWLLRHGVALWDLVARCAILGSADSDIVVESKEQINDISALLREAPIRSVFCNGNKSFSLLKRYFPEIARTATVLPSTSPANVPFASAKWEIVGDALRAGKR